jgi:pyruvate dehydrogenase E2 component (dihydrolipoamide acetyltransferase)
MFEIIFADIGEGIHEGVLFQIPVEIGQEIEDGDTLYLVETDKVTAEIPSPVAGKLAKINFKVGDTINVGDVIMLVDDGSGQSEKVEEVVVEHEVVAEQGSTSVVGDLEISSEVIASSSETVKEESYSKKVLATPVARKLAKDLGIDIQTVKGTGPAGRVKKADIQKLADENNKQVEVNRPVAVSQAHPVAAVEGDRREKMSQMRKTIAAHMTKSKFTIPHTAVMDELEVSALVKYRSQVKMLAAENNVKLTYLPLIIKAVVVALKKHEIVNSVLDESTDEIVYKKGIHIGIAVDTPFGLTVPVIKDADKLSILELAKKLNDLNERAQSKALTMDEISGSTFTITNYGALGSSFGVPVINYPNAAILGIGMIAKKPVVLDDAISIGSVLPLSMSFDHRIIDGADAGRFMQTLKALLSDPQLLLLS